MRLHDQLHVQVSGGAAAGAHLALALQVDPVAGADPGGDLHVQGALAADPALPGALAAGVRDDGAVAAAVGARLGGADVAQEGALDLGDLAVAVAGGAGHRLLLVGATGSRALGTDHRGVHTERLGDAEGGLGQGQRLADQGVLTTSHPGARPA